MVTDLTHLWVNPQGQDQTYHYPGGLAWPVKQFAVLSYNLKWKHFKKWKSWFQHSGPLPFFVEVSLQLGEQTTVIRWRDSPSGWAKKTNHHQRWSLLHGLASLCQFMDLSCSPTPASYTNAIDHKDNRARRYWSHERKPIPFTRKKIKHISLWHDVPYV